MASNGFDTFRSKVSIFDIINFNLKVQLFFWMIIKIKLKLICCFFKFYLEQNNWFRFFFNIVEWVCVCVVYNNETTKMNNNNNNKGEK